MVPARRNQNWLPSIFNDFLGNDWLVERRNATAPAVNILENDDEYKVEVAAPGMTKEDFKVHLNEDNELIISMEKKNESKEEDKEHKGTYLRREFSYTQFQQSLLLPDNVERDKISAKVENGVMTIEIPKRKVPGYRALFFCNLADGKSLPMHESRKNPYLRWGSGRH